MEIQDQRLVAAASAAGVPGVVGAAGQQPHVIVPSIIKPPADRLADDCGLQSDGFGKREITLFASFPSSASFSLPSINIACQIMGTRACRRRRMGSSSLARPCSAAAHLISVFGQRNHEWGGLRRTDTAILFHVSHADFFAVGRRTRM